MNDNGQFYVICAPSGTGKSTLVKRLTKAYPRIRFSISHTTRAPRQGEEHGRDYFFTTVEEFKERIENGFFAEWAKVHGNYYGTPLEFTTRLAEEGHDVFFDIDVQGAAQLRDNLPHGCFIMLLPPSREALVERLSGRGTDDEDVIAKRLRNAARELAEAPGFDYWIVNDDLERAYSELETVYLAQRLTPSRDPGMVDRLLAQWGEANG